MTLGPWRFVEIRVGEMDLDLYTEPEGDIQHLSLLENSSGQRVGGIGFTDREVALSESDRETILKRINEAVGRLAGD